MRVFLPSTLPALAQALRTGHVAPTQRAAQAEDAAQTEGTAQTQAQAEDAAQAEGTAQTQAQAAGPVPGFAVTPALREAYASGDEEELEYAALTEAARASLRMLAADPAAPSRRVVFAAEIPAEHIRWDARGNEPARVQIDAAVPLARLVSAHVDDLAAAADVRRAVDALPAADTGDDDAKFAVDSAEGHELGWFATQELPDLFE
jgi:hypothetical protein